MGSLDSLFAFICGFGLAAATAVFIFWRQRAAAEEQIRDRKSILEQDFALKEEDLKRRAELSLDKRRTQLEQAQQNREIELRAREEAAHKLSKTAQQESAALDKRRADLEERFSLLEREESETRELTRQYRHKLESLGRISPEAAREELLQMTREECEEEIRDIRDEYLGRSEKEIEAEARRTLIACMQRLSAAPQEDITATIVAIPGEEMKGRIIGREGRNIKSFESITGTTLLIDETPDSVLISSFDPVRRETARIALESLIKDGRIHPASIEEAVRRAEEEVRQSVVDSGEEALRRLRLGRMHPEIVSALGRLRFRLSNNQNSLEHSIEVANLCALTASELGLDTDLAKRSGLLHDIGKVLDEEHEGSHALAGSYFLKRLGSEDARVINAVAAHHGEVEAESPYVGLVMIADSLSAMRPGARADSLEGYLQRVRSLEEIALAMEGVTEAYAIQAGREIRVMVSPQSTSESEAAFLARRIRRRIEDELQYPGTIRVTVIREQRFSETAH
jgi:ribonuclease Y